MRTYEIENQVFTKAVDTNTSKYWTICIITNSLDKNGNPTLCHTKKQSESAEKFFKDKFPQISIQTSLSKQQNQYVQTNLWNIFHNKTLDLKQRALAGLCLRCYVSHGIVTGCQVFANKSVDKLTLLESLLSYVLNDDGRTLIVTNTDNRNQLILKKDGQTQPIKKEGNFFSVEIISTYKPNISGNKNSESLENWSIRLIKQNNNLQPLLLEYGVWTPSDWSLLCKEVPQSLENSLQNRGRDFIKVFHEVYRRDRRKYLQRGSCSEPTQSQLEEMLHLLQSRNIILNSTLELTQKFAEIADILRQDKYSRKTGSPKTQSIDVDNSSEDSNDYFPNTNQLSKDSLNSEDVEENELRVLLNQLPPEALFKAISLKIPERVEFLASNKSYSAYAHRFVEGLQLIYHKNFPVSLNEIAQKWQINWSKARRIFRLRELIENIQDKTVEIFISKIKDNAGHLFASEISSNPNSIQEIGQEVRSFLNQIIFKEAFAEITSSKTPEKNSSFADVLRKYVNHKIDAA